MLYLPPGGGEWDGYMQAAMQYMMSLVTVGYTNFRISPMGGPMQYDTLPKWARALGNRREYTDNIEDVCVMHLTPDSGINRHCWRGRKLQTLLTVTETECIPGWLAERLNDLDAVILPSEWNRQVFINSGVAPHRTYTLPHTQGHYFWEGVERWRQHEPRQDGAPWTFYYVGVWNNRKNPEAVLRAYLRAFPQCTGETRLVLKTSRSASLEGLMRAIVINETGSDERLAQDVNLITDFWNSDQIQWLHAMSDCCVSAHRGEGWGLSPFYAALVGNQVLCTGWSATEEFLTHPDHLKVPFMMTPVRVDGHLTYFLSEKAGEEIRWAEPDMDALVEQFRKSAASRIRLPGEEVARLRQLYGWETVGADFVRLLNRFQAQADAK